MSEQTTALVPIEERQVDFTAIDITAALVHHRRAAASNLCTIENRICEYLTFDWSGQYRRTKRHPVPAKDN